MYTSQKFRTGGLSMKYSKEERLDIGGQIYNNEISQVEACKRYEISKVTARDYMRLYRATNDLPEKGHIKKYGEIKLVEQPRIPKYEEYESMTKEELIQELVKARINEARLKKGYEVKGVGVEKVYIPFDSKNTK